MSIELRRSHEAAVYELEQFKAEVKHLRAFIKERLGVNDIGLDHELKMRGEIYEH